MFLLTRRAIWLVPFFAGLVLLVLIDKTPTAPQPAAEAKIDYAAVQPLIKKYCLDCHSTKAKKGSLDLERFTTLDHIRKDLKPWQGMIEMIEAGEMPPKEKPQPTADEKKQLIEWVRAFLDSEARRGPVIRVMCRCGGSATPSTTTRYAI